MSDSSGTTRPVEALTTEELLPIVYDELRRIAGRQMMHERREHTLQPTALVHEVYLRLKRESVNWASNGQFFSAAAKSMRRILIEHARRKKAGARGGQLCRVQVDDLEIPILSDHDRLIDLDGALATLAKIDPRSAEVAELRVFAGLTLQEVAETLGLPQTTVYREWQFAFAWLKKEYDRTP